MAMRRGTLVRAAVIATSTLTAGQAIGSIKRTIRKCRRRENGEADQRTRSSFPGGVKSNIKSLVSVVVPVLNESKVVEDTLSSLLLASPRFQNIVIVDGGSNDGTFEKAKSFAKRLRRRDRDAPRIEVIKCEKRGRGRQMNEGARLVKKILKQDRKRQWKTHQMKTANDVVGFVHADTFVPTDVCSLVSGQLNDLRTVCVGFHTIIEYRDKTFWAISLHNSLKTHYIPAVLRPLSYIAGLRLLFGDQCMFMRLEDYFAVNGFDEQHSIMEDADMCLRLHNMYKNKTHCFGSQKHRSPGKIKLINRCVRTSGRRIDRIGGTITATCIHFIVSLSWFFGASPKRIEHLYHSLYGGDRPR